MALFLALLNPYIDQITDWHFYSFGADNARAVLLAIASSMLTVVTLTFSILMVSFTLASQQFSPRILRTFTRDRTSQHVLGLQIGTFLYSLLVMVRINEVGDTIFVPLLSVLGAIGFSLVGISAFIYFIDHISRSIRVNYIIANIGEQTVAFEHAHLRDTAGTVRLLTRRVSFATMVELAFNQIRHYGCGDVLVDIRMIDALTEIAGATGDPQRRALLWQHIGRVSRNADRKLDEPYDREQVNACLIHAGKQMGYEVSALLLNHNL